MRTSLAVTLSGLCLGFLLTGCSDDQAVDKTLRALITEHHLNQPFQPDIANPSPLLATLGGELFFSPDLSIDGSVACASCHHPNHAGTDGIALPIGIGGQDSKNVGQARIAAAQTANPEVSLEGLIPRNSPAVINAALYRKALFWDGRVQYQDEPKSGKGKNNKQIIAGFGAAQHNPSNYLQENLLQTQARMPLTSSFEMKGGQKPNRNSHEIEQDILSFLQSQEHWCKGFAKAFGIKPCNELITLNHLTQALAAFQATLVLTNSPFQRYIEGDNQAISIEQKRGAIAFLTQKEDGGAGCVNCHNGKTFSSERFYNINIPASGRGANDNGWDLGRHNVDRSAERFSFRVPILLNVAHTGPYFHNGIADTLEDAIRFKQTATKIQKNGNPIHLPNIDYGAVNQSIEYDFAKGAAKTLLPEVLAEAHIHQLAAFLRSLSDDCLTSDICKETLIKPIITSPRTQIATRNRTAPEPNRRKAQPPRAARLLCQATPQQTGSPHHGFTRHGPDLGLQHSRSIGLVKKGWLIDVVNYASVSALDLNNDCLDDLVFDAGSNGLKLYYQQADGYFAAKTLPLTTSPGAVNALVMDLDGDYRYDLFMGNYGASPAAIYFDFQQAGEDHITLNSLTGPVINAAIGDINQDGEQDLVVSMWRSFSSFKQPHLWFNDGQGNLSANEGFIQLAQHQKHVGGNAAVKRQNHLPIGVSDLTFTPNLVDTNGDGLQDLLLASDFFRSQVLVNREGRLQDSTDKTVIDDTNGMGAAVGDFDNDGDMDWFVTSIVDTTAPGLNPGHRLYMNNGDGSFYQAPIVNKQVEWSWGACSADFNNDGHMDLFYISGYGESLSSATYENDAQKQASEQFLNKLARYKNTKPTLLINQGDGTFKDESPRWGFERPLNGRGIACFDYQQDGDIDIVIAALEGEPVLYINHLMQTLASDDATEQPHWLALRIVGPPGNTEALGTKVTLRTAKGQQTRQVRFENNFVSRNPTQIHFGLGPAQRVEQLIITFPAPLSKTVVLENPAINQLHVLHWNDILSHAP